MHRLFISSVSLWYHTNMHFLQITKLLFFWSIWNLHSWLTLEEQRLTAEKIRNSPVAATLAVGDTCLTLACSFFTVYLIFSKDFFCGCRDTSSVELLLDTGRFSSISLRLDLEINCRPAGVFSLCLISFGLWSDFIPALDVSTVTEIKRGLQFVHVTCKPLNKTETIKDCHTLEVRQYLTVWG